MDSVLRPRDIQARIRSGESPETVAAAAQTSIDKVMVFASPVLAERAYVAQQAQRASVRRRTGDGAPGQLGLAVAERLAAQQLDPEAVEWDAWRRDDGRWTLVADVPGQDGPTRAEFVYDAAGRYVTATDEQSRWLVGERVVSGPAASAAPPAHELDEQDTASQLHLGDDAIELVTGRRPAPLLDLVPDPTPAPEAAADTRAVTEPQREPEPEAQPEPQPQPESQPVATALEPDVEDEREITVDLTEPVAVVRAAPPATDTAPDAGWMDTQASERPSRRTPAPDPVEALFEVPAPVEEAPAAPEPTASETAASEPAASGPSSETPETSEGVEPADGSTPARARTRAKGRSKGRAAIPSWDEIMFGSNTGD